MLLLHLLHLIKIEMVNVLKFKLQVANLIDLNNTILNLNKMSEIYDIERIFK